MRKAIASGSACLAMAFLWLAPSQAAYDDNATDTPAQQGQDESTPKKAKKEKKTKKEKKAKKEKKDKKAKKEKKTVRFEMKTHPSLRVGEWLRADFLLKFQHDFRSFEPEFSGDEGDTSNLKRLRVGVEGYVTKNFEYTVERELRNEVADLFTFRARETHTLWRDVYGNFRYFRPVQLRVGQQKIPFGLDQLHGTTKGEFVFRSLIGNALAPGRDLGIMAHGKLLDQRVQYQAGLFKHDGWRAHLKDYERSGERTFAGRVVVPPLSFFKTPGFLKPLKNLELGGAFTESPVTEGLHSLHGRTWVVTHTYFNRINVRGQRLRLGAELRWEPGPFSVKGEVIRVSDQRLGQGTRDQDLPDLIARGWYLSTSWMVTGEKKAGFVSPRRDFVFGHGIGAVELAARDEQIRFGSAEHAGLPSRSTRAANLFSTSERAATFGVNWYLNRFTRVQFNAIREVIEDPQNTPITGQDTYWSRYIRLQFVF